MYAENSLLALPPATSPAPVSSGSGSSLFQRVASGNEGTLQKCFAFLQQYNMPAPSNRGELAQLLAQTCIQYGDEACKNLAAIHPDADFIKENMQPALIVSDTGSKHHCDCGCGGKNNNYRNDLGSVLQPVTQWASNTLQNKDIVLYVLAFLTIAFVFNKLTAK